MNRSKSYSLISAPERSYNTAGAIVYLLLGIAVLIIVQFLRLVLFF